jgi:hypothetical protein
VIDEQKGRRSAYIGIWIVAILLPLYFAFFYAGRPDTGKYVCIGVGMHLIGIRPSKAILFAGMIA